MSTASLPTASSHDESSRTSSSTTTMDFRPKRTHHHQSHRKRARSFEAGAHEVPSGPNPISNRTHWCIHTGYSGRTSPLVFELEIERAARLNKVAKRLFKVMNRDEPVIEELNDELPQNPPPVIPPNNNNHDVGPPPPQTPPDIHNRFHNGGNGVNWGHNVGENGGNGNHNGGNHGNWNYDDGSNNFNGGAHNHNDGFGMHGGNVHQRNHNGGVNHRNNQGYNCGHYNEGNHFLYLNFPQPNRQSVASHFQPREYDDASPILFPEGNELHVEIRPQLIGILPLFRGHKLDDPYNHLYEFLAIANANIPRAANRDSFRLHLFPFTLKEKAKYWFTSLAPSSITTWDQLKTTFLQEFYPASKTSEIRKAIQDFTQKPNEEFHDAFERLKELLRSCPHHEFPRWQLVRFFYDGIDSTHQAMINASSDDIPTSSIASVGLDKTWKNEVKTDITNLNKRFDLLLTSLSKERGAYVLHGQKICVSCGDIGHTGDECKRTQAEISAVHGFGQFQNAPRPFNRPNNQGGYNNNNNHGSFQHQNQPRSFQQPNYNREAGPPTRKEDNDSNKLDKIMEFITQTYQKTDTNTKSIAAIEKQIA
ncbi:hypothetical protein LXL04_000851 [Taraxacum kok-saghyz]